MSSLLDSGDLAHTPVAALLIEALNLRATGVLTVHHDGAESRAFLRDGVPVGAQTFAAFKPLGQLLLASKLIDMDVLGRSLAEMARSGRQQGEVLVAMGAVAREQVDRVLSEQQAGYLTLIAGVDAGTFSFEEKAVPDWTRGIRIAPLRAIVHALEQPQAASLVASAIGEVALPVTLAPGYARLAGAFGWSAADAALVSRLEAVAALGELAGVPGVPLARSRAVLAALLLLGLAAGKGAAELVTPAAVADLAEVAGEPLASDAAEAVPERRAAPEGEDQRARRQRLLRRAMQNVGTRPFIEPRAARPPPPAPEAAAGPTATDDLRAALDQMLPRARNPDLFARLGVGIAATRDEVRNAYFRLAKRFHPDRFAVPGLADLQPKVQDLFAALNAAYEVLSDDRRRAEYVEAAGRSGASAIALARLDFQKGETCSRTHDLQRARGFYEAAAKADPRPEHLAALAWILVATGDAAERSRAKQLVSDALRDRRCVRAAFVAGMIARQEGSDAAAEKHFRAVLALDSMHAEAQRELRAVQARQARRDRPRD